jgi:hypothetical protein
MHELNDSDREAVLMRYFENRQLADIAERLGLSDEAARKRVDRALEKLRGFLSQRGITELAALTTVISANAVQTAPAGLAATLTSASLAGAASGAGVAAQTDVTTLSKLVFMTKLKAGIVSSVAIATVATTLIIQRQAQLKLRAERDALRQQLNQLIADNESRTSPAVQRHDSLTNDQLRDLLRLRAEVTVLREQTNELAHLQEDNRRLQKYLEQLKLDYAGAGFHPGHGEQINGDMDHAQRLAKAIMKYADQNQGQLPPSLEEAVPFLNLDMKEDLKRLTQAGAMMWLPYYEIVYSGSLTNLPGDARDVILVRQKRARLDNGTYVRSYAFADGHSEWHEESVDSDEIWKNWENRRFVTKQNPGQTPNPPQ